MPVDHEGLRTHLGYAHAIAHDMSMPDDDSKADSVGTHLVACHKALGERTPFKRDDQSHYEQGKMSMYKSLRDEVLALTGAGDEAKALGILTALKTKADQVEALTAQVEELKAAQKQAEATALLDEAVRSGQIVPVKREELAQLSAKHGLDTLKACLNALPKKAPAAIPPVEEPKAVALGGLSDAELEIVTKTGLTPEKFLEHRRAYRAQVEKFRTNSEEK